MKEIPEHKLGLDTPTLLIDLNKMEDNIDIMAGYFETKEVDLRPHMKTHKTPIIAHKQIEAGAVGVTCQKLGEAEVFAQAGIEGILISNQVANEIKILRLVNLSKWADVTVGVDNLKNVKDISRVAESRGATVNVAIEIYMGRCGVRAGEPVVRLARNILELNNVGFKGIWSHDMSTPGIASFDERERKHEKQLKKVIETKEMLEAEGIPVELVSAGYTGTYNITGEHSEITDVQAGSYVFMDWPYRNLEGMSHFNCALTVLTTVISKQERDNMIITDCGKKSISTEHSTDYANIVFPEVKNIDNAEVRSVSEEHALIELKGSAMSQLKVGDKLELIPAHSCTTTNLHDRFVGIREEEVETVWPILARGKAT